MISVEKVCALKRQTLSRRGKSFAVIVSTWSNAFALAKVAGLTNRCIYERSVWQQSLINQTRYVDVWLILHQISSRARGRRIKCGIWHITVSRVKNLWSGNLISSWHLINQRTHFNSCSVARSKDISHVSCSRINPLWVGIYLLAINNLCRFMENR